MFDRDTSLLELAIALGVRTKQVELLDRCRVHRRYVKKGNTLVIARFSIYVAALPRIFASVGRSLELVEGVSWEDR